MFRALNVREKSFLFLQFEFDFLGDLAESLGCCNALFPSSYLPDVSGC
jgi:hypothetical protein